MTLRTRPNTCGSNGTGNGIGRWATMPKGAAVATLVACSLASAASHASCEKTPTRPDERYQAVEESRGSQVRDLVSTLIWQRCLVGKVWDEASGQCTGTATRLSWQAAAEYVAGLPKNTRTPWRLPTHMEWVTLVDLSCRNPAVNGRWFADLPGTFLWSVSPYLPLADYSWGINMKSGELSYESKTEEFPVWLVRSAR
jgi:hypothetical protein